MSRLYNSYFITYTSADGVNHSCVVGQGNKDLAIECVKSNLNVNTIKTCVYIDTTNQLGIIIDSKTYL